MVFHENVVAAIKVDGKILRETGNSVFLPFGSEYSVLIKNLNSVRIEASVTIDGTDTGEGKFIIDPNSDLELERFIRNGNLEAGNRFKFIERTSAVEKHRGIGIDDGIVRIESWTERVVNVVTAYPYVEHSYRPPTPRTPFPPRPYPRPQPYRRSPIMSGLRRPSGASRSHAGASPTRSLRPSACASRASVPGITVAGSESRQRFVPVGGFSVNAESSVIVLHLCGEVAGKAIVSPLTVNSKPTCITCGKTNKASSRFCVGCGTALELI